jgi:hypothetical protein
VSTHDIYGIAVELVDILASDEALRDEAAKALEGADAVAAFARFVTGVLKLQPPLELAEVGPLEDAMAEIYLELERREDLARNIRNGHRRYSTARG